MAKKNLFNAETMYTQSDSDSLVISKKAVLSYISLIPFIEAHGRSVSLSNKGFGIGRDKCNAVIISDPKVSKYHAHITFKKGTAYIQDAGSKNGIWINKKKIPENKICALKNKDVIVIGNTQILFKS